MAVKPAVLHAKHVNQQINALPAQMQDTQPTLWAYAHQFVEMESLLELKHVMQAALLQLDALIAKFNLDMPAVDSHLFAGQLLQHLPLPQPQPQPQNQFNPQILPIQQLHQIQLFLQVGQLCLKLVRPA